MTRWRAELQGDPIDLNGLAIAFADPPVRVVEEGEQFCLEAEELEHLTDRSQVKAAAERLITRLNGAMRLGNGSFQNVKLRHLRERRPDGNEEISVFVEPATINIRASVLPVKVLGVKVLGVKVLGGAPTKQLGDPARSYIAAAGDPDADEALDLWANEPHDWMNLYKVFEIIRARGGLDPSVSKSELGRFTQTANDQRAAGRQARHARSATESPKKPMGALEAEALIRRLLQAWLDSLT